MSDKTCGTCVNYVPFPLRRGEGLCFMTIDDDFPMFMRSDDACDGGVYSERTDSLEAVALDAVRKLEKAAALIDVERWEQIVYSQVGDLRARLKALGVEP